MQIIIEEVVGSGELWLKVMKIICGDAVGRKLVDLGCHKAPYTPLLGYDCREYIDIQERLLDHINEQRFFVKDDIIHYLESVERSATDFVLSDVLEHFSLKKGYEVVRLMCMKGYKNIIFTPLGEYLLEKEETDNPDAHRSGWIPEMLPGYTSIIFPDFHKSLNLGAFFAFNCNPQETERICKEIKS